VARSRGEKIFHAFNYFFISFIVLLCVLPFVNIIALSFSSEHAVASGWVSLFPVEPTLFTYKTVFTASQVVPAMRNTVYVTLVGTAINIFMTILASYSLSKHRLRGRNLLLLIITFTMLFNAGTIPNFILIRQLGLFNTYYALWLPGAISTYNMIVLKTFFQAIPDSLEESASIDGASELRILLQIIIPLSLPSIATITLFYAVGHWNAYYNVMLYINQSAKYTLQRVLRDLINMQSLDAIRTAANIDSTDMQQPIAAESIKSAAIVIATAPILAVYPFLQKYFVKGVMIGSIKG